MHSCRVQPISRSRSGIGTVATMSLEMIARRVCSSRSPTAQAFVAITTRSAVSDAARACAAPPARGGRGVVTRVPSWMRTPSSSATRRSPRTSSAGCTIAPRRLEEAGEVAIRAAAPGGLLGRPLLERHHAELAAGRHDAVPGAELGLRGGRPEVAAAVVVRVDPVLARRTRRSRRRPASQARASASAPSAPQSCDERAELGPPGDREAAVAAARAAAADVLLEHDDVARRLALLDADGRPEAGVAAAHDRDVGARSALERRGGGLVGREGLVEPERAVRHGPRVLRASECLDARDAPWRWRRSGPSWWPGRSRP